MSRYRLTTERVEAARREDDERGAGRVIHLVNALRLEYNRSPLERDPLLTRAAKHHARDMAKNDYFSHTGRDGSSAYQRAQRFGYPSGTWFGENILYGQQTADEAFEAWKNSDPHFQNMIGPNYRAIGIGRALESWDTAGDVYDVWTMSLGGVLTRGTVPPVAGYIDAAG